MNMAGNYRYTEDDACPASLCSVNLVNLIEDPVEPEVSRAISRETQVSIPNLDELTLVPSVSLGNIQEQKKEYFDIAMLYDDADIHRVRTLADILKKFIFCNGEESLSICCDHNDLQNAVGQLTVVNYERKLESSYCYFVFFSKKPCETAFWTQFQNYCALDHRLKNPDIHQLVPVVTGKDVKLGISFNGIQPVVISELLIRHRSLDEVVVDRLTDKDVNMKIVNGIAAVLKEGREKNSSKDNGNAVLSNSNDRYTVSNPKPTTQFSAMTYVEIIQLNISDLVEYLQTEYGLLTCLYSSGAISRREMEEVEAEKISFDRNEKLLKLIQDKKDVSVFEDFLRALKMTNQAFIAEALQEKLSKH